MTSQADDTPPALGFPPGYREAAYDLAPQCRPQVAAYHDDLHRRSHRRSGLSHLTSNGGFLPNGFGAVIAAMLAPTYIIPSVFHPDVTKVVAAAVRVAALSPTTASVR